MENNNQEQQIDLMCFDLGEQEGGKQLILDHKSVSPTEHYVFTIGDGPKKEEPENANSTPNEETTGVKKLFSKQPFMNLRNHFIGKKPEEKQEENNVKLRCFKLSLADNGKFLVKEYKTTEEITEVAKMFDL